MYEPRSFNEYGGDEWHPSDKYLEIIEFIAIIFLAVCCVGIIANGPDEDRAHQKWVEDHKKLEEDRAHQKWVEDHKKLHQK